MYKLVLFALFFIVSNPILYRITTKIPFVGDLVVDEQGRPSQIGTFLHSLIFLLVIYSLEKAFRN